MAQDINREVAKDIVIAMIQKMDLIRMTTQISADQAIDLNGEAISKLYKTIYKAVDSAHRN